RLSNTYVSEREGKSRGSSPGGILPARCQWRAHARVLPAAICAGTGGAPSVLATPDISTSAGLRLAGCPAGRLSLAPGAWFGEYCRRRARRLQLARRRSGRGAFAILRSRLVGTPTIQSPKGARSASVWSAIWLSIGPTEGRMGEGPTPPEFPS